MRLLSSASCRRRPLSSNVRAHKAPCPPTPRKQRPRRKQPKASCPSRPRERGDGQHQHVTLTAIGHRRLDFGQGRLEAGQSKRTRTPPLAAKRLTAAIASWPPAKGMRQRRNRHGNSQSAGCSLSTRRRREVPRLLLRARFGAARIKGMNTRGYSGSSPVRPNPSLKRSANGRPPGPVWRYAVHFRQPGPGVLPLSPA